jgi:hypothetical protein
MNASRFTKFNSSVRYLGLALVAFLAVVVASAGACLPPDAGGGGEGDRCNPSLSHNECGSGLTCTQPTDCPENYCCPTSGNSSNPFCQTGCAGGSYSIAVAGFYLTCSTSTPSPLCGCFNPPIFAAGTQWALQVDAGPECYCFAEQDPLACLAAAADAGTPMEAGDDGTASSESGADGGAADAVGN